MFALATRGFPVTPVTVGPISHPQIWGDRLQVRPGSDTVFPARFDGHGWKVTAAGREARRDRPHDGEIQG
jgi:hypothetical protein